MEHALKQNTLDGRRIGCCLWGLVFGDGLVCTARLVFKSDGQLHEGMMRKFGTKGFKVIQDGKGKAVLEPIPFYGRTASQKAQARKSKKVKVIKPFLDFWGKGKTQ